MSRLVVLWIVLVVVVTLPKWGTYHPSTLFTLLNSQSEEALQFGLAQASEKSQGEFNQQDFHTKDNEVKWTRYLIHDGQSLFRKNIKLANNDETDVMGISDNNGAELNFSFKQRSNNTYFFLKLAPKVTGVEPSKIKLIQPKDVHCSTRKVRSSDLRVLISRVIYNEETQEGANTLIICDSVSRTFNISFTFDSQQMLAESWAAKVQNFEDKMSNFMGKHELTKDSTVRQIVQHGLSTTLSNIALWDGFVGKVFGFRDEQGGFDIKYSMLLIDVLADFDFQLAHLLMNNTIEYLQDKIIYGEEELDELPCPEHIEAVLKFPNDKALKVINGLVFRTFFQRVNKVIGKEEDYTASKRIHPILLTMLQTKWHSRFGYLAAGSVYTESFLDDLFLNTEEESQDLSLSKFAWLLKSVLVLKQLNAASGQPLSMVEINSLIDLMTKYLAEECTEKQGNLMRSINKVGRNRYYTKSLSIESLLPHVYQLYAKYQPTYASGLQLVKNLTTLKGVQSMESGAKSNYEEYKFRGNIVPYFNYKILKMLQRHEPFNRKELIERFKKNPNVKSLDGLLNSVKQSLEQIHEYQMRLEELVRSTVQEKVMDDWRLKRKMFGWWSPTGKSFQPDSHLVLLNALFLRD